ncbi:Protein lethal(2)denticleless [Gryllus bimaculatus]|nr:Protein lethal(2)denticleless [Gryllus bimaculatus]
MKMIRKNSKSRCNYLLSREKGERVKDSYDFVLKGIKKSCTATVETETDLEFWRSPVFASYFCPQPSNGSLLAAANEIGQVMLWDLRNDTYLDSNAVNDAHDNAIFDMAWSPNDLRMITASGDKSVVMWDCNPDLKIRKVNTFTGHTATAKTCAWSPDNAGMICTGDRSGVLFIWDTRSGKLENRITNAHERARFWKVGKKPQVENTSITGIVFYQPFNLITAAAGTEKIRLWDLRKYYAAYSRKPQPVCEISHKKFEDQSGYACLTIDRDRHRFFLFSAAVFTGGILRSFYSRSCLSPDGKYLFSGSSTENAVIWNTSENVGDDVCPLRKLTTSGIEVNTVAWCKSGDRLKIGSADLTPQYFDMSDTTLVGENARAEKQHCPIIGNATDIIYVDFSKAVGNIAAFPECEPCEIFAINASNTSSDLWDCDKMESEDMEFDAEVSQVKSVLPPTTQSIQNSPLIANVSVPPNESEIASPTLETRTLSKLFISAGHNRKRVLEEMLENESEDRQNKKIKLRGRLSPRRLFISSSVNDENCESLSVQSHVTNRFDVNDKDSLVGASSSEFISNSEDEEKNYCQFTASDTCEKIPFSPTSNLTNHASDMCEKTPFSPTSNLPNHTSDTCEKTPFSPTSNLPNHVVDGTSPSHVCKPYRKKRLDWLTELRHGKVSDLENSVPKKVTERNSCKNENTKKLHKKGHESILKFFRVLGKPTDEQLKSSPGCRIVSNNQSS